MMNKKDKFDLKKYSFIEQKWDYAKNITISPGSVRCVPCVRVNLFVPVLIVPIWSAQLWFQAFPCPPYSSIYHKQQWRDTEALSASRWILSNGSRYVTLLNQCEN